MWLQTQFWVQLFGLLLVFAFVKPEENASLIENPKPNPWDLFDPAANIPKASVTQTDVVLSQGQLTDAWNGLENIKQEANSIQSQLELSKKEQTVGRNLVGKRELAQTSNLEFTNLPCGDWEPYLDEKCFKIIESVGLQTFDDASKTCRRIDPDAHLLSIAVRHEQEFLENFLFNKSKLVDNVWLGSKFSFRNKYEWENSGADLSFTNWAPGRPKNRTGYCIQMESSEDEVGLWSDEPCKRKNVVVCEKVIKWSLAAMQEALLNTRKSFQEQLEALKQEAVNPGPVGFIYVQLPKTNEPSLLWPRATWTDVSTDYANVFFRIEGSETAPFGSVQKESSPKLEVETVTEQYRNNYLGSDDYCNFTPFAKCEAATSNGVKSKWLVTGTSSGSDFYASFKMSNAQVRPKNMAVRVWKRTA